MCARVCVSSCMHVYMGACMRGCVCECERRRVCVVLSTGYIFFKIYIFWQNSFSNRKPRVTLTPLLSTIWKTNWLLSRALFRMFIKFSMSGISLWSYRVMERYACVVCVLCVCCVCFVCCVLCMWVYVGVMSVFVCICVFVCVVCVVCVCVCIVLCVVCGEHAGSWMCSNFICPFSSSSNAAISTGWKWYSN